MSNENRAHALFNEAGHVTLARPIRFVMGDQDGSIRIVAFDGRVVDARDGFVTFAVDTVYPHPDDRQPTDPPALDGWATDMDSDGTGTVTIHVEQSMVASLAAIMPD